MNTVYMNNFCPKGLQCYFGTHMEEEYILKKRGKYLEG